MNELIIQVHPKIFSAQPTFHRGIVAATNMNNWDSSPQLQDLLSQAIKNAAIHPIDLAQDPLITRWDEAHRQFESNPNKFPPAQKISSSESRSKMRPYHSLITQLPS